MANSAKHDAWSMGDSYDQYMGRWSRQIAVQFLDWLDVPAGKRWLDVGCGTGALTLEILNKCNPTEVHGVDRSGGFITHARANITDTRASFAMGGDDTLNVEDGTFDVVGSALMLNFVSDKIAMLKAMRKAVAPDGLVSFYVWDYPGVSIGFIDAFWRAATQVNARAAELDESSRFPECTPDGLGAICEAAGMADPKISALEIDCVFDSFEDFWLPFTLGAGPAPGYCVALPKDERKQLKKFLQKELGAGPISLPARAWGVKYQV